LTLIVQIVLALTVLVGLVTLVMSSKNWHWTQLVLVIFLFLSAIGFIFLGAETVRIHRNLRSGIPRLEKQIASLAEQNEQLQNGQGDQPGILALEHQLQIDTRERGRVWRGVMPAGQVDQQGRVAVEIAKPLPHGLDKDAIIYVFEMGEPNPTDPTEGAQYLGEFRVTGTSEEGASLEPVLLIDNRSGKRLASSKGPWRLYETMPIDRHRLFAGMTEEALAKMLPAESALEYVRHGSEATADDDQWHVTGIDQDGHRVGPENLEQAVKKLYDRPLRDYAFIFNQLAGEKVVALAKQKAVVEDTAKLQAALVSAEATAKFRQQQLDARSSDLAALQQDRAVIDAHRDAVLKLLAHWEARITDYLAANSELARQFTQQQLGLVSQINRVAPAP
jgi:hypothetical protein